ncbi:putative metal-binding motif-containing protein [Corallococcus sicarius]|uniref:Lipoprotein n=1 Tax=Corallococcus sicarius TaxID=2316726 RepID=A0A3A8M9J0_9BACT|nr:putative metal-binding motif-containing protein [Corallococcus sicarius]RKH28967.1 hypothetical protein D7X12_39915 [Corallococcus sicarius]
MRRLLLLLPLFALAGCKDPQDGVRVIVNSTGFTPRCIKVTAEDDATNETLSTSLAGKSSVVVGIVLPEKWGKQITIRAEAFEQDFEEGKACEADRRINNADAAPSQQVAVTPGAAKDDKTQVITLDMSATDADGDGYVTKDTGGSDCNDIQGQGEGINPGATELCTTGDRNCNGVQGPVELEVGKSCPGQNNCKGVYQCNTSTTSATRTCEVPPEFLYWRDQDKDKHGAAGVPATAFCPENPLPAEGGYVSISEKQDDCDDTEGTVFLGAPDICDDLDNDCDGIEDNNFTNIGMTCPDPVSQCNNGSFQCNPADGGVLCQPPADAGVWYPDEDDDKHGRTDAGVVSCPQPDAGYIRDAGDCDDGNPFIYTAAAELCDVQDNNCNSVVDDGALCPQGGPTWANQAVYDAGTDLFDVSLYGDGGVWIVGSNSGRAVKTPSAKSFALLTSDCTNGSTQQTLYSVWAHPQTGTAYIGRDQGALVIQNNGDIACTPSVGLSGPVKDLDTRGLTGFAGANLRIFGVGYEGGKGATFEWDGGTANVPTQDYTGAPFQRVHGLSPEVLFAVGKNSTGRGVIYRWDTGTSTFKPASGVPDVPPLRGIHVVNAKLAFAAGNDRTLLRWDGSTWTQVMGLPPAAPSDPPAPEHYTGVLTFGANSIYVITESGSIYRYDGKVWTLGTRITSLYGIAGTSPEDIWVVGRFGNVFHYPAWPQ